VISSEESYWNADIINYDDLSVISSSDDEIDDVTEIRSAAGTATEGTGDNLHQLDLKHNDVDEISSKLTREDVIATSSSSMKQWNSEQKGKKLESCRNS